MSSTESAQALHDRSSDSDNEDGGSVASSSNGSSNSNSSMASSTAAPLTEQELAQRRHDDVNVRILLQSKWSRRLKATPRIRIWNMTTGGRTGRDEIVDTAIGYMAGQFAEQIQEICSAFRENLARVAAGLPPHTPATDARGAGGDSSSAADSAAGSVGGGGGAGRLAPFAFDVAAVTGVGNELPGQSAFGRSLLVRQLARAFRTQCTEGFDTHAAVDDAVPPKVESTAQLLALHEARSESESDDDGDEEGEWEEGEWEEEEEQEGEEDDDEEDDEEERYRGGADNDFDEQAPGADGSDGNGGGGGRRRVFFTLGGAADTRDGGRHDDNDDGNGGAHVA